MTSDDIKKLLARKKSLGKSIELRQNRIEKHKKEYEKLSITVELLKDYGLIVEDVEKPSVVSDMVLTLLKEYEDGLLSIVILTGIQNRWRPELARTSLSPILTRLKSSGEIVENDGIWRIK